MEEFEREYADELEVMNTNSGTLDGPLSRRSLDLRGSFPTSSEKKNLWKEAPLPTVSPGKLQCPARHHANMSIVPPAISHLSITPSRPAVASGVFSNSARPSHSISTSNVGDAVSDLPCDPILSPLPHPSTPTASSFDTLCTYDGIWPKNTTSKQQRPSLPRTHLFTSKYQQELDAGLSTSPSSSSFVIERFNSVYKSVSTQPETEEFGSDNSCSPLLGVDEVLASLGVLRRAPAGLHVTVTGSDGCRVYLNLQSTLCLLDNIVDSSTSSHLLPVSFSQLKASVQEERRRKLIEQSEKLITSAMDTEAELSLGDSKVVETGGGGEIPSNTSQNLWVDKYAPRQYTHLLSDDGINRTLLSWIKLWDETVFGQKSQPTSSTSSSMNKPTREKARIRDSGHSNSRIGSGGSVGRGAFRTGNSEWREFGDPATFANEEALDESRRPQLKLALLCGPPGLGKTTLAHIIAHHAGYHAVEMNASDDRSADLFRHKLESATQMQPVLTPDHRPTCLIIDEIDGAPTAAINVLIELVKVKDSGNKKKKKQRKVLARPVICICNDQYTPSLRQLRHFALVLVFPPTLSSRLASRLQQVMRQEGMISSISTLMALCEKADNDIRACLNTLQFFSRQRRELTLNMVRNTSIGEKDAQMSLFSLWKGVFQLPSAKRHQIGCVVDLALQGYEMSANAIRFHHMLLAATATGDYEKACYGLFENYPNIRFKDPNLEAVYVGMDWVVFHDTVQQYIAQTQSYSFLSYLPFLSVAFHFLFAAPSKPYIRYPQTNYEMFQKKQQCEHLLSSVMLEVPPHIHRMLASSQLAVEMLCPILEIITPTFRPVSTQLYTVREKQQLADLVDTMISYGLTYKQEKGLDGQYTYVLDPCLEEVCRFPGLVQRKQLSYSAKQLIAREVEVEKMRRSERLISGHECSTQICEDDQKAKINNGTQRTSEKGHSRPIKQTMKEKPAMDFFGRRVQSAKGNVSAIHSKHPLWFKFNEGFSNAVRRPVRIQDLL